MPHPHNPDALPGPEPQPTPTAGAEPPDFGPSVAPRPDASDGLGDTVARGVSWTGLARIGAQGSQFVAGIALARLLSPEDYGLMALVYLINGFLVIYVEAGIGGALIQLRDPTERDLSTAFWLNALGGLLLTLALVAASPLLAAAFDQPAMAGLVIVASLSFALSFNTVPQALLDREMKFQAVALLEIATTVASFVVAITAAAAGAGPYALAVQPVVKALSTTIGVYAIRPWRPRSFVTRASVRRIWAFSGGQMGFNAVNYWARSADNLLIGRFVGVEALGLYSRAYSLMLLPVQQLGVVLSQVMFPALSAMGDDRERIGRAYRRAVAAINSVSSPMLVGLACTAPALIPALWGDQWAGVVPLLQILCVAGIPQVVSSSVGWLYQSQGRTGLMFRMGAWTSAVVVVSMIVGLQWGAAGVAWSVLAYSWITTPVILVVPCRLVGIRASRVLLDAVPTLVIGGLIAAVTLPLPFALGLAPSDGATLMAQLPAGAIAYVVGLRLLQPSVFREFRARAAALRA